MEFAVMALVITLAYVLLAVAATVSLSREGELGTREVVWLLVIWLVTFIGPVLWFAVGRQARSNSTS